MSSSLASRWTFFDQIIQNFRFRKVRDLIPKECILADCGCGTGEFLKYIERWINKGYGIESAIERPGTEEKIEFIEGNLNKKIPLSNESIDVVTALAVIEHIERPDIFVKETFRILKKDGYGILTTPSPKAKPLLEFLAYKMKIISEKDIRDHKNYFSKDELELIFSNFSEVRVEYFLLGFNTLVIIKK